MLICAIFEEDLGLLQLKAVNYYHKELHLGYCSSPKPPLHKSLGVTTFVTRQRNFQASLIMKTLTLMLKVIVARTPTLARLREGVIKY